jgi:hypothetical protein
LRGQLYASESIGKVGDQRRTCRVKDRSIAFPRAWPRLPQDPPLKAEGGNDRGVCRAIPTRTRPTITAGAFLTALARHRRSHRRERAWTPANVSAGTGGSSNARQRGYCPSADWLFARTAGRSPSPPCPPCRLPTSMSGDWSGKDVQVLSQDLQCDQPSRRTIQWPCQVSHLVDIGR